MSLSDYYNRKIPEYYDTMYLDGYTPQQILTAIHRKTIKQYMERNTIDKIKITSEVKVKK